MHRFTILFLLTLLPSVLFAQNIELEPVQMETIATFPFGSGSFEMGYFDSIHGTEPSGPSDILVTDDFYYMFDYYNRMRFVRISRDLSHFDLVNENFRLDESFNRLMNSGKYILSTDIYAGILQVIDIETNSIVFDINSITNDITYLSDKGLVSYGFTILDNYLIGETRYDRFLIIDLETKSLNEMSGVEATEYFSDVSEHIEIKDNKYIFYKGHIITSSPEIFYDYIQENNENFSLFSEELNSFTNRTNYSGQDQYGYTYWTRGNSIYIFDNEGTLIKKVGVDSSIRLNSTMDRFSVDNEGNLYRLVFDEDSYSLNVIKRFWAIPPADQSLGE